MSEPVRRRAVLAGAALLAARPAPAAARSVLDDAVTVDLHSHAGALIGVWRVNDGAPFLPLAAPMRQGGMAVVVLAIVPDAPCYKVTADTRIEPFRPPDPIRFTRSTARIPASRSASIVPTIAAKPSSAGRGATRARAPGRRPPSISRKSTSCTRRMISNRRLNTISR